LHLREPLRQRLQRVIIRLNTQVAKLKQEEYGMEVREKGLISKATDAVAAGDQERAKIYANEAAELRKAAKTVFSTEIALERVALRLETALNLGDFAASLGSSYGIIKKVSAPLKEIMPQLSDEMASIEEEVGSLMSEAEIATSSVVGAPLSEDAEGIMKEAEALAESRVREGFPEPPADLLAKKRHPIRVWSFGASCSMLRIQLLGPLIGWA